MSLQPLFRVLPAALLLVLAACSRQPPAASAPPAAAPAAPAAPAPEAAPAPPAEVAPPAPPASPAEAAAPAATAAPAAAAPVSAAAPAGTGEKVYKTYCQTCHGNEGKGDGPAAVALNPKPASFAAGAFKYDTNGNGTKGDIEDIRTIAHDGAARHGGSPLMTPWPMLSAEQLQAVAEHVKSLHRI